MFRTTAELISLRQELENKLQETLNIAEEIHAKEKACGSPGENG